MQVIVVRGIRGREAVLVSIADRALLATPVTIGDVKDLLEVQTGLPRAAYASLRRDTQLVDGLRDDTVLGECNLVDGLSLTAAAPLEEACVGGADFDHLKAQATEQRGGSDSDSDSEIDLDDLVAMNAAGAENTAQKAATWIKKIEALEKEAATRDKKIGALEEENKKIPVLEKKIAALEEENAILKKKKEEGSSSGSFTTRTGLSDEQVIAILQGDGDKDRTVVAKSVQEQREEASARETKAAEMVAQLLPGGKVPGHTQLWLDGKQDEVDDDKMRAQAVEPAKWLLEVLKHAYLDRRLHGAAVSLLIKNRFTRNLNFLEQYAPLKAGLAEFLRTFGGDRMRVIYDDHDLGTSFADAEVRAVLGEETGQRSQAAMMPGLFDGLAFGTPIDRFVNNQVALHMLLMVARAADGPFQQQIGAIAGILAQSATGFGSGPVKQFPRPWKKALADYAKEAQPRVACNLDPIRCLLAARDGQSMFRVMRALRRVFGPFPKWKNLFAMPEDARAQRYHLASIMITVPFELGKTYGELAKDPAVQRMWDRYCETPEGVPRERWQRDAAAARAILASKRMAGIPVKIYGEVQLLLESYVKIRDEIHAAYEFLRAASEAALHEEMVLSSGNYTPAADADGVYSAAFRGQRDVAAKLIAAGADVNAAQKSTGATPLYAASEKGHVDVVQLLADRGADVNAAANTGMTPLCVASQDGHVDVVQLLADRGADVNAAKNDGQTPIFAASRKGHANVVKCLIDAKAAINAKTPFGTALAYAIKEGHADVIAVLKAAGAK